MTKLTQQEFDDMAQQFLATQSDDCTNQYYSDYSMALHTINHLRTHLFAQDVHNDAERQEYLRLKAKYEMS